MKVINFNDGVVSNKSTIIYGNYYNIHHGDPGGWIYKMSVDKRYLNPENNNNKPLPLIGNKFACSIIKDANDQELTDRMGNCYRTLSKKLVSCDDIILFCRFDVDLIDICFDYQGMIEKIGSGLFLNTSNEYKSPGPVFYVYGDFKLSWAGVNINGEKINKSLKYDYDKQNFEMS